MGQSSWTPALPPALASPAKRVVRDLAGRLRDQQRVGLAVAAAPTQTAFPLAVRWLAPTLGQGDAGIAMTCAYLDACWADEGWDRVGHNYLTTAAVAAEGLPQLSPAMFGGLAGLAFAAWSLSRGATRYRNLLATLDDALLPQVTAQANGLAWPTMDGMPFGQFDVISGLAGIGAYLLLRCEQPGALAALEVCTARSCCSRERHREPGRAGGRPPICWVMRRRPLCTLMGTSIAGWRMGSRARWR